MFDDTEEEDSQKLQKRDETLDRIIEIILYQLTPDTGQKFHQIMEEISVPLHQRAGLEIVTYGISLHDADTYFLIRAFDNLAQRTIFLNRFYQSNDWQHGPRSDILDCIQSSTTSVLSLDESAINMLKNRSFTNRINP